MGAFRNKQKPEKARGGSKTADARRERRMELERRVLKSFIRVFCRNHHGAGQELCTDCADLQAYALKRLERCPYDPKPKCKKCPTHCYRPDYRMRIKEVMKYSGIYYVKRGRLDWLVRYFMI
ncbi:MAG: nitrous oxide-stimulated promoter family protein [Anaerolineae bacterium]|nr:nitrous oxide-stimulated promoter family protein [Anaerolineae bacterium]